LLGFYTRKGFSNELIVKRGCSTVGLMNLLARKNRRQMNSSYFFDILKALFRPSCLGQIDDSEDIEKREDDYGC